MSYSSLVLPYYCEAWKNVVVVVAVASVLKVKMHDVVIFDLLDLRVVVGAEVHNSLMDASDVCA